MAQVARRPAPAGPLRWQGARGAAGWAVTGRAGGVSTGPAAGLNLGDHVGDDAGAVAANRALVLAALPPGVTRTAWARQVHGRTVAEVGGSQPGHAVDGVPAAGAPVAGASLVDAPLADAPVADALVTTAMGVALAVVVADCVPVVVLGAAAVGVAHAGRRGMDLGVVPALVSAVRDLEGLVPSGLRAVLGPSVCPRCYPVPAALRDDVAGRHPAARARTPTGEPSLDVAAGVLAQLERLGVPATRLPGCTVEDPTLYSARRDGAATGRTAALVWLAPR